MHNDSICSLKTSIQYVEGNFILYLYDCKFQEGGEHLPNYLSNCKIGNLNFSKQAGNVENALIRLTNCAGNTHLDP